MIDKTTVIDARPTERPSPEVVLRDRQNLIALRPPIDPATGMMIYDTQQASQYHEALQSIVSRYGDMGSLKDALKKLATSPGPQLASTASPGVPVQPGLASAPPPNFMTGPPATSSLMQFAQKMMAQDGPPSAADPALPAGPMPQTG